MPCGCTICDPTNKHPYCICGEDWKEFQESLDILINISKNSKYIKKEFGISTITVCTNFGSHIDLKKLASVYESGIKYNPKGKKSKKINQDSDCFYNSLIMNMKNKYQDIGYISVKFFPNGKLQIAGCKNVLSCAYSIRKAFSRILKTDCFLDKPKIHDSKIVMINSDFKLKYNFDQINFCDILNGLSIHEDKGNFTQVNYQPSKYPAINTKVVIKDKIPEYRKFLLNKSIKKFSGLISILIFRPGSVILTGGNDITEYLEIFKQFMQIIDDNHEFILDTD